MNKKQAKKVIQKVLDKHFKSDEEYISLNDTEFLQALDYALYDMQNIEELEEKIKYLEKANKWIDVRDRLPSDDEIAENYGEFEITYFDTILKNQVTIAEFCKSNKYAIVEKDERGHWYDWEDDERIDVIAWRPLPQPYERKEQ